MPVPSSINDLSTTPGSNSPAGSESPATFDDYMRTFAAFIAQLRDGKAASSDVVQLTGNQTIAGVKTFSSAIVGNATNVTGVVAIANGGTGSSVGAGLAQTGDLKMVMRSTAPDGWVKSNGGTIGNASSGATTRANADTQALFELLWTEFTNAVLPIQTSAGGASTRGASAAADWAANKRMTLPDMRGEFARGWDDSRGIDTGRVLGSSQAGSIEAHTHTYQRAFSAVGGSAALAGSSGEGTANTGSTGGTETRPRNVAVLYCIKL